MAGRNKQKVESVRADLAKQAPTVEQIEVVTADISDQASLESMCSTTDVVLSLVGPYAKYGKPLVKVSHARCAASTRMTTAASAQGLCLHSCQPLDVA